jgi:hypothetical protein
MRTTKAVSLILKPVSPEEVTEKILLFRDKKVMVDSDLAKLYGVPTGLLNLAVKRNIDRFPLDFMFQLTKAEAEHLTLQTAISNKGRGGRRTPPYVFTEQGVAMLSSVLNSRRAIQVNIEIMRAFAKIREMILSYRELQRKINDMEQKYDKNFSAVFDALRELIDPPEKPRRRIGFKQDEE